MKIEFKYIKELHSLYGGIKKRKDIGNPFQALVSHSFGDTLIFAIIENVNLNKPSLFGLGDTLFFTHFGEDAPENDLIKEEYKRIILEVEKKFNNTIAEYVNWYDSDSVLITVDTNSKKTFNTDSSGWRTRIFANREEKGKKDKYGFLEFEETESRTFKKHVEDYFNFYIELLGKNLSFYEFPHFVVLAKPIYTKDKTDVIKLGNLYLHFATTQKKSENFYHKLLNDFLLIWLQEEGSVLINQIKSQSINKHALELAKTYKTHLPSIWLLKDNDKFNQSEIDKFDEIFGTSGRKLNDFYDEVFIIKSFECNTNLEKFEKSIIEELIPILLKHKGWLKEGVTVSKTNTVINNIKKNVEHKEFRSFTEGDINRFISLLSLRHIVNLCFCCFGLSVFEIHSLLSIGDISMDTKSSERNLTKLTSYFSKLFFFSPKGKNKNILTFNQNDALNSASIKEKNFIKSCVSKIMLLIKENKKNEYNDIAVKNFQLYSNEMKKFNTGNVSRLAVFDFKKNWCNENQIIPELLKEKASKYLVAPILDCGAGLGDIANKAFPEKEAILIDVNPIEDKETPTSPLHKHVIKSIFDFFPEEQINTLLISHTLQFIDSDIDLLNKQIKFLSPKYIIVILNENNDIMGEILKWTKENYENSNPEEKIEGFPIGYECIEKIQFTADVKCNNFTQLSKQISYLMMIDLEETGDQLEKFIKGKLKNKKPAFKFNQVIEIYQKSK